MRFGPTALGVICTGWLLMIGVGLAVVWEHQLTPGQPAHAPAVWPEGSAIPRTPDRPALLLLAHPRCPCLQASLTELEVLLSHRGDRVEAFVVLLRPEGSGEDWLPPEVLRRARSIPGVRVLEDHAGDESRRFGAVTSGQALLYDARGHLLFSGGITGSRAHAGDNPGRRAVESLLDDPSRSRSQGPVFGCSLSGTPDKAAGLPRRCKP